MILLLPYPMAILRLMLSYGILPKPPGRKKIDPVVVVTKIAVDDSLAERSNGLQYQKIRMLPPHPMMDLVLVRPILSDSPLPLRLQKLLRSKRNPVVIAADDDIPVERSRYFLHAFSTIFRAGTKWKFHVLFHHRF